MLDRPEPVLGAIISDRDVTAVLEAVRHLTGIPAVAEEVGEIVGGATGDLWV